MPQFEVVFYETENGQQPAKEFLLSLEKKGAGKMNSKFDDFLQEQLQDPEIKQEYDALQPERAILQAIIEARKRSGLTQKELSERTGIAQSDISKLEHGNANPSIRTLQRLASAMGMILSLEFLPDPAATSSER